MKTLRYRVIPTLLRISIAALLISAVWACNENMEDTLRYDYPESGSAYGDSHVLLIVLDGVSGRAVQTARNARKTPVLRDMADRALYTDYGLGDNTNSISDGSMTNARGWANLMLGNTMHGVRTFEDLDMLGNDNLISRLAADGSKVEMYASSEDFRRIFGGNNMVAPAITGDLEAKNSLLSALEDESKKAPDLLVTQFRGGQDAGETHGFYTEDGVPTEQMMDAVETLDRYIGEIKNALEARPDYKNENWLVIVTSTYGGEKNLALGEAGDHYDDVTRNTFTLIYNERLVPQVQGRPGDGSLSYHYSTPVWSFDYQNPDPREYAESAVLRDNTTLGNMEFGQPMTILFFVRLRAKYINSTNNYVILSKANQIRQRGGWSISFYQNPGPNTLLFLLGNQGSGRSGTTGGLFTTPEWSSIAITYAPNEAGTAMLASVYVNGKLDPYRANNSISKSNFINYMTGIENVPLRIGSANDRESQQNNGDTKNTVATNSFSVSNIQIYNVALSEEEIERYAGMNQLHHLGENYPLWDNLIGYWPCDLEEDAGEPVLKDYSKYAPGDGSTDFVIDRGSPDIWTTGFSSDPGMHPIPESDNSFYHQTINTVDISRQIFMWLGKPVRWSWNLEGQAWPFIYRDMEE